MPTYEYKCTECAERFEIEQSIHEDALTTLAGENHEHQLKKVFSPVGISFRGGGFYKNDSRSGSSSSSSSGTADSSSSSETASSDSPSSDSGSTSTSDSSSTAPATTPAKSSASSKSSTDS